MNWKNQALTRSEWALCLMRCTHHLGIETQAVMECFARNSSRFVVYFDVFIVRTAKACSSFMMKGGFSEVVC